MPTALASATDFAPVERVHANGLDFEVFTAGDPASPRLALCLHGFPEHPFSWRHQLPVLAELGYRVWAPSQRGYGRTSPRPADVAAYHVDQLLADVAGLIRASGRERVTLIAHDWGGIVAWIFALGRIAPLDRLIVMNLPHPQRFLEALRSDRAQRRRSRYERLFQLPRLPEWLFCRRDAQLVAQAFLGMAVHPERFGEEVLRVYRDQALQPGAMKAMLDWYRANPFREVLRGPWRLLETPTLLIWGVHDSALGRSLTERTGELVRDFELHCLEASHWVQQDAPDEVNAILREWLAH